MWRFDTGRHTHLFSDTNYFLQITYFGFIDRRAITKEQYDKLEDITDVDNT